MTSCLTQADDFMPNVALPLKLSLLTPGRQCRFHFVHFKGVNDKYLINKWIMGVMYATLQVDASHLESALIKCQ